jgi:hypothetical protein
LSKGQKLYFEVITNKSVFVCQISVIPAYAALSPEAIKRKAGRQVRAIFHLLVQIAR